MNKVKQIQFISLDFDFLDNPLFKEMPKGAFWQYLWLRRFVNRNQDDEYYQKGYLACRLSIETLAEKIGYNDIYISENNTYLKKIINIVKTGRENVYILGEYKEIETEKGIRNVEIWYSEGATRTLNSEKPELSVRRNPNPVPVSPPTTPSLIEQRIDKSLIDINVRSEENRSEPQEVKEVEVSIPKILLNFDNQYYENISEKDLSIWQEAYPAVDVKSELLRSSQWLISNPKKMKKNLRRFITSWLSRAQENGGTKKAFTPLSNDEYIDREAKIRDKAFELRKQKELDAKQAEEERLRNKKLDDEIFKNSNQRRF